MSILDKQAGVGRIPHIAARYVITAELVLDSPAHFGDGEKGDIVDMMLLRNPLTGQVFLPGSSLAGALRSYACDYLLGYGVEEPGAKDRRGEDAANLAMVSALFGGKRGDNDGDQSALAVFDCYESSSSSSHAEIRDGVAIRPATGIAEQGKKFDIEVLPRGTKFSLHLELKVSSNDLEARLLPVLTVALQGLEQGDVLLGSRRTRGFGRCHVKNWLVRRFDLRTREGWLAWLATVPRTGGPTLAVEPSGSISEALKRAVPDLQFDLLADDQDQRRRVSLEVRLKFRGGLLIRSPGSTTQSADVSHLFSAGGPVLPGTSLAGVLRTRALRIARIVRSEQGDAEWWIDSIFGPASQEQDSGVRKERVAARAARGLAGPGARDAERTFRASRLFVSESSISGGIVLRSNRIMIDRFTGGVVDNHLFEEEPVYGATAKVDLELRCLANDGKARIEGEVGLLLLAIKDLLTGDLNVGGTGSVGRGFADGSATLRLTDHGQTRVYEIDPAHRLDERNAPALNALVEAFAQAPRLTRNTAREVAQ